MPKALLRSSVAGIWVVASVLCHAQMSPSFPAPPPLPRPASSVPQPAVAPDPAPSAPVMSPAPQEPAPLPANSAETLNSLSSLDNSNNLHVGDRISYRVIEDRDPAVSLIVTDTGEINVPYLGRFKILGMTCHDAAVKLKSLLEQDLYKRATVIIGLDVIAGSSQQQLADQDVVWLVGQVKAIGPRPLSKTNPLTVSQIILSSGGFGDFADQRRVRLIHRKASTNSAGAPSAAEVNATDEGIIIDCKALYQGGHGNDPIVQPNDMIIVPKKVINW